VGIDLAVTGFYLTGFYRVLSVGSSAAWSLHHGTLGVLLDAGDAGLIDLSHPKQMRAT
jgi:hypothetical protein